MADRTDVVLKEYEIMYREGHQSITLEYSILAFGFAFLGILAKAIIDAYAGNHILLSGMLSLGITVIAVFVLYLWMGEVFRARRVGVYISELEKTLQLLQQHKSENEVFGYQSWLFSSSGKTQFKSPYIVVYTLLGLIGAFGIWASWYIPFRQQMISGQINFGVPALYTSASISCAVLYIVGYIYAGARLATVGTTLFWDVPPLAAVRKV